MEVGTVMLDSGDVATSFSGPLGEIFSDGKIRKPSRYGEIESAEWVIAMSENPSWWYPAEDSGGCLKF